MAAFKVRKFRDVTELEFFLNGGVYGGSGTMGGVTGLVGKDLLFTSPSATTCTFVAGADPLTLTFAEIKTQIEAAMTTLKVIPVGPNGCLGLIEKTPSSGVALKADAALTKQLLGFPYDKAVVGKVYLIGSTAPCVLNIYNDVQSNSHVLVTWE
jgi:hypothetical protein